MQADRLLTFGPYRSDPYTGQLWRGKQEVRLTGKAASVLRHLVEHAGQVVTKEELFHAVWPETVVSDAALTSCIQELRHALHDNARKPRFIETVHRRGFRFRPAVTTTPLLGSGARGQGSVSLSSPTPDPRPMIPTLVGRESELTQLHGWLAKALNGERQIVFVTGEPGIGKTTLIENFVFGVRGHQKVVSSQHSVVSREEKERQNSKGKTQNSKLTDPRPLTPNPQIGWGQCIEHYGAGEAYLPILEALGRLCREADGARLIELLQQHAPTWLVQMPALLQPDEIETLQRKTAGATRERMLRELAEALEVITAEHPLVLVLEDLHWSDVSTLDLLSMLARRQEPARLLIIGTYRPVEVLTRDHPLKGIKQELQLHGQCEELALDFLTEAHVAEYLEVRFSGEVTGRSPLHSLARVVHRRTDGNPLFMVNVTNELVARGVEAQHIASLQSLEDLGIGIPENLRQLIEQQITRVSLDERKILEAASVAGAEFSAAAVAAGTEQTTEAMETHCDDLVRREQFLRVQGTSEWPDGTVAVRYGFVHALYQEVLYEQSSATRRIRLHRQIGECEEQGYGERAKEIAAELAVHFERGRDYQRAVQYLQQAGENAVRRFADQEAVMLFSKGIALLHMLPDIPARSSQELKIQIALCAPLISTKGYAAPELEHACIRARELCQQLGNTTQLFSVLAGLRPYYAMRTEHRVARELADQLLTIAQEAQDPALLLEAHVAQGNTIVWIGEFTATRVHFEQGLALYDPREHRSHAFHYGQDPAVACLSQLAQVLWLLGYPERARQRGHEAIALAQELSHPNSLGYALGCTAMCHQLRREPRETQEFAEAAIKLGVDHGFPYWETQGTILRGAALAEQGQVEEGLAQMRDGLTAHWAIGGRILEQYWLALQVEAYQKLGQTKEAFAVLEEALTVAEKNGERFWEAELYRLRGELTLAQSGVRSLHIPNPTSQEEAEGYFLKAIEIARTQQAKSLELRATTSLARLWQSQSKKKQAHNMLSDVYHWFTEGFDTKDLQEAQTLLAELSH